MNAGDLGSRWVVCACAYDPIHVTAQGKRLGLNCACVPLVTRFYAVRSLKLCEECGSNPCACSFSHGVTLTFMPKYGHLWRQLGHVCYMLDSDWWTNILLRCDWLLREVALMTTTIHTKHVEYCLRCCFLALYTTFKDYVFQQALKTQLYSDLYLVSELLLQKRSANSFYMENKI